VATSLRFQFASLEAELSAMKAITQNFMAPGSEGNFDTALNNLKMIRTTGSGNWQVRECEPLTTAVSNEYEKDGDSEHAIFGEVSWKWGITAEPVAKKNALREFFQVTGNASAIVRIRKYPEKTVLAEWRAEVGAIDSPGCYFHSHITSSICVPRLPALFVTPMDSLEFLLGELFQSSWPAHASSEKKDVQYWRSQQSRLLGSVLDWKRRRIESTGGSPWVALKFAKPEVEDGLFSFGKAK
jgi:hypothetical protein